MSKENTKFELLKLDTNNLIEFEGWENRMKKVVEENPFITITDKETYKTAKKRLSNVKAERVLVENQDKSIASFVTAFRKKTMTKKDELVIIVKPLEDQHKAEVDRWEKIIQDEKDEEKRIEDARVDEIKGEIKRISDLLDEVISKADLNQIDAFKIDFNFKKKSLFKFQEFEFMFHEMVDLKEKEFKQKHDELIQSEEQRISDLKEKMNSKLNQMVIDGLQLVDEIDGTIEERLLKQMVSGIFQCTFGCHDVTFDEESIEKMNSEKEKALVRVHEKITKIELEKTNEEKQRIFEVREGLLDLVHQMTVEDYETKSSEIKGYLKQDVLKSNQEDFDKMKSLVLKSLEQKMALLQKEIEARDKKLSERLEMRIKAIVKMGMVVQDETDSVWNGFGLEVFVDTLYDMNENEFDSLVEEITTEKESDEKEKERQLKLANDKEIIVAMLVGFKKSMNEKKPKLLLDNQEMIDVCEDLKRHFEKYCDLQIELINKF